MTHKQKIFVKEYIDNKGNGTAAARQAYNVSTDNSAALIASENLRKPQIQSALADHDELFRSVITNTAQQWSDSDDVGKRNIAVTTAKWGYEQIHGKATQRTESVSASFIQHVTDKKTRYQL
jgi:phage terminase small subunit